MRADTRDYRELFLRDVPMLDTRAPVEFGKGAFPGAINLPLMDDAERQQVGLCYKQQGQDAAIALGHQLVSGQVKARRVARSEEHTSELQSLQRISYAVFCLKNKKNN